jgi:hypothetical protein
MSLVGDLLGYDSMGSDLFGINKDADNNCVVCGVSVFSHTPQMEAQCMSRVHRFLIPPLKAERKPMSRPSAGIALILILWLACATYATGSLIADVEAIFPETISYRRDLVFGAAMGLFGGPLSAAWMFIFTRANENGWRITPPRKKL